MDKATRRMLNRSEQKLLRDTEPAELRGRDEDDLVVLHRRVRKARNKYTKLYRRRAGARVAKDATRAMASKANRRTAVKAEVFEDALARVSLRLSRLARVQADELRDQRLAAAKGTTGGRKAKAKGKGKGKGKAGAARSSGARSAKAQRRTPVRKRAAASSRATTKRAQAKKDRR